MTESILAIFSDNFFLSDLGIVCFVLINIVLLILCFPAWILSVCAGFLYGPLLGLIYELVSIIVSTFISYFIGERFPIKKKYDVNEYFKRLFRSDSFDSFVLIFLLKVNPIVPFTPVIYYLGYIRYSLFKLLASCTIASIPLNFLYALMGNSIGNLNIVLSIDKRMIYGDNSMYYFIINGIITIISIFVCIKISSRITKEMSKKH